MSHDDFCRCTFEEFEAICRAWRERREADTRDAWERARTIATILLQPHTKKGTRLTPERLLPLPWDKQSLPEQVEPKLTPEERRSRFEDLAARVG